MTSWTAPTVSDFKAFFVRDFAYAKSDDQSNTELVLDSDISRALQEAGINFNRANFGADADANAGYLYLAAFQMVENIKNSSLGVQAQFRFPVNQKSVGSVAVSFDVPERFKGDPQIIFYTANGYGWKYLSLVMPRLVGRVRVVRGGTDGFRV